LQQCRSACAAAAKPGRMRTMRRRIPLTRERLIRYVAVLALLVSMGSMGQSRAASPARQQTTPVPEQIPLRKVGGVYTLPVELNAVLTLHFVLDSGAADVQIPPEVAL